MRLPAFERLIAALERLPGVGPKTAAIVLCFSLGRPAFPVDTHIYRVSLNRWELERRHDGWLITRRLTRLLGHDEGKAVLQKAFQG